MLLPVPSPVPGDAVAVAVPRPHFIARPLLEFKFVTADKDVAVQHGLGRVPLGWIVVGLTAAITPYNGSAPSSEDVLVLRASGAGTAYVLPF